MGIHPQPGIIMDKDNGVTETQPLSLDYSSWTQQDVRSFSGPVGTALV